MKNYSYAVYNAGELSFYPSYEEAKTAAQKELSMYRQYAFEDGEWDKEVESITVCKVLAEVKEEIVEFNGDISYNYELVEV